MLFLLVSTFNLIWGDKFIGRSTAKNTNHKLWMNYLEKRLDIFCRYVSIQTFRKQQIFSLLQFYTINLQRHMLNTMSITEDANFLDIVQKGIFGSIRASSKSGEAVAVFDRCIKMYKHLTDRNQINVLIWPHALAFGLQATQRQEHVAIINFFLKNLLIMNKYTL